MRFSPVVGGLTLPRSSLDAFRSGQFIHVPLLQGTNHDEGRFFVAVGFDLLGKPITAQQYPGLVQAMFGASAPPTILARYPLSNFRLTGPRVRADLHRLEVQLPRAAR